MEYVPVSNALPYWSCKAVKRAPVSPAIADVSNEPSRMVWEGSKAAGMIVISHVVVEHEVIMTSLIKTKRKY